MSDAEQPPSCLPECAATDARQHSSQLHTTYIQSTIHTTHPTGYSSSHELGCGCEYANTPIRQHAHTLILKRVRPSLLSSRAEPFFPAAYLRGDRALAPVDR